MPGPPGQGWRRWSPSGQSPPPVESDGVGWEGRGVSPPLAPAFCFAPSLTASMLFETRDCLDSQFYGVGIYSHFTDEGAEVQGLCPVLANSWQTKIKNRCDPKSETAVTAAMANKGRGDGQTRPWGSPLTGCGTWGKRLSSLCPSVK